MGLGLCPLSSVAPGLVACAPDPRDLPYHCLLLWEVTSLSPLLSSLAGDFHSPWSLLLWLFSKLRKLNQAGVQSDKKKA